MDNTTPQLPSSEVLSPYAFAIRRIRVEGLFGQFTYNLSVQEADNQYLGRLFILYGDNGSGKTTLLNLIFHLLSPEGNRGHRTFLASKQFESLSVELFDGTAISVDRTAATVGAYDFTVRPARGTRVTTRIEVAEDNSVSAPSGRALRDYRSVLNTLASLGISMHLLADNRKTWEDSSDDEDDIVAMPSMLAQRELAHRVLAVRRRDETQDISLGRAIARFTQWARQQALRGSNIGVASANTIYSDIISRIGRNPIQASAEDPTPRIESQIATLEEHSRRAEAFARFGLLSPLAINETIQALRDSDPSSRPVLVNILQPYIDSVRARLDALQGIHDSLESFVTNLNRFYGSKDVRFHLQQGLTISSSDGAEIDPTALSSGERQLLLLFCSAISAQDRSSIFIIDEPELSLNVKWQRGLVRALLETGRETNVQLLLATHSIELLARHRACVAHLVSEPQGSGA